MRFLGFGVSKIGGTHFGVPRIRIRVLWGLCWGPLILGIYQIQAQVSSGLWLRVGRFKVEGLGVEGFRVLRLRG